MYLHNKIFFLFAFAVKIKRETYIGMCVQDGTVCGIYHWSGSECMTKYEMAVAMGSAFELPVGHLQPDNSQPSGSVRRPHDTQLACRKIEALGIGRRTLFCDAINECLKSFVTS